MLFRSMSNIKKAFENGKAFIAFITCGDPDLETTAAAIRAAVENGADLIELGIPFSDPTAEGPVIQGANIRALNGGVTTDKIFAFVKKLRYDVKVPMVFMTYSNVVFSYGAEKFISTCKNIEIDGLILPDLPFEEKDELVNLVTESLSEGESKGNEIQVYIGNEAPVQTMKDCSVVTATYDLGEGVKGTIGIVGPKRMDYENVVDNLKNLKSQLDGIFDKEKGQS